MQAVILAGGFGTRISEESHLRPKPMVEIGGMPIIWHIMKLYSHYGIHDFIICCGYRGYMIKEYFANYLLHCSDVTIDLQNQTLETHRNAAEPWRVTLVDTGIDVGTGGRLTKIRPYLDGAFCMTYGDGVSNVDISKLLKQHNSSGLKATLTGILPQNRFGMLSLKENKVIGFEEKPENSFSDWINGGFFVLEPEVLDAIASLDTFFEKEPLQKLAADGELGIYRHNDFWMCMDTLRDKQKLEALWQSGDAPWRVWK